MRNMNNFSRLLENNLFEVFVIGEREGAKYVIAFRQWIWVFNTDTYAKVFPDIVDKLKYKGKKGFKNSRKFYKNDIYEFMQELSEEGHDVIIGEIVNGNLHFPYQHDFTQSSASKTLEKVLKELGLKGVTTTASDFVTGDEIEMFTGREEFLLPLANKTFYHGTSMDAVQRRGRILQKGIMPIPGLSNYGKIRHSDKIFLTLKKDKAWYHARNASEIKGSFPIIIATTVPDVNKLVLDYDVAIKFYANVKSNVTLAYKDIHNLAAGNKAICIHL